MKENKSKISIEIDRNMYRLFKSQCVLNGVTITEAVNRLIEEDLNKGGITKTEPVAPTEPVEEKENINADF